MIIFTANKDLVNYVQGQNIVYNLSSYHNGIDITKLATHLNFVNKNINEYIHSREFDMEYAGLLINNNELFINLMKIMINVYEGYNCIILVSHDPYRDAITESLCKFIQERYGYMSWCIDDIGDIDSIHELSFSAPGILNLDMDRKRYVTLYMQNPVEYIGEYNPAYDQEDNFRK